MILKGDSMSIFGDLVDKSFFVNDKAYEGFIFWLEELFNKTITDYDFLMVSKESWITLFKSAIVKSSDFKDITSYKNNIYYYINLRITNFIQKEINANKTDVMCNLIYKVYSKTKNKSIFINSFIKELDKCHITFDNDYFNLLKNKSKILSHVLNQSGLFDILFSEYKNIDLDLYFAVRVNNINYQEMMNLYYYYCSFFPLDKVKNRNSIEFKKIILFLNHVDDLINISSICKEKMGYSRKDIETVLAGFDISKIDKFFQEYKLYQYGSINGSLGFLYALNPYLKTLKENEKINSIANTFKKSVIQSLYDLIPEAKKSLENENLLKALFYSLDIEEQIRIQKYLNGELIVGTSEEKLAIKKIQFLNRMFIDCINHRDGSSYYSEPVIVEEKKKSTGRYVMARKGNTIYDYVPMSLISPENKKILDIFYQQLPLETRTNIENYLSGNIKSSCYDGIKAGTAIQNLKRKVEKFIQTGEDISKIPQVNNECKINIYDYVPESKENEEAKLLLDELYNKMHSTTKRNIECFLSGELDNGSKEYKLALDSISRLRRKFKENTVTVKEKSIYYYFPGSLDDESKKAVVDFLIDKDPTRKEKVIAFALEKDSFSKEEKKKIINYIYYLKKQYNQILSGKTFQLRRKESIYDFFPECQDDVEKKEIVDSIFDNLQVECQEIVNKYLTGNYSFYSSEGKKFRSVISQMKRNYFKTLKIKNNELPVRTVYQYIDNDLTVEKIYLIDQLVDNLYIETKQNIMLYLKGEFGSETDKGRKALKSLYYLKRKYFSVINNTFAVSYYRKYLYRYFAEYNVNHKVIEKIFKDVKVNDQYIVIKYLLGYILPDSILEQNAKKVLNDMYNQYLIKIFNINLKEANEEYLELFKKCISLLKLNKLYPCFESNTYILVVNLSLDRLKLLVTELELLEIKYRKQNIIQSEYQQMMLEYISEQFLNKKKQSLEELILNYINNANQELKKNTRTLEV